MKKAIVILTAMLLTPSAVSASEPIDVGSRRELFVDDYLIESLQGTQKRLHHPTPREIALVHDEPWEGNVCYYHTVFKDGDLYRMYYRGAYSGPRTSYPDAVGHQVVCYAESPDGLHWVKPNLGLCEFQESKENNILWTGIGAHNFAPFKDPNPDAAPEALYKAIGSGAGGLYVFQSADGIHWSLMRDKPVITRGAFDSQNLAFFDAVRGRYVDFHRGFNQGVRAIMTCTSNDFINWTEPNWIDFNDDRHEHLYTNQTTPYYRAPHLFVAFPKRFAPSRNLMRHRHNGVSDIVFMTSRDGQTFDRWGEAFLRPGLQRERWYTRNNFVAWGIVETASHLAGAPDELTFYSMESYYTGDDCRIRRCTLRPDGFVSVKAPLEGGELVTKPLTFAVPEPSTPRTVRDELPLPIRVEASAPVRGRGSLAFESPAILTLEGTKNLGPQATLAVTLRGVPPGRRRLFSTYNGSTTSPNELYFDIYSRGVSTGSDELAIRFNYNDVLVGATFDVVGDWSRDTDAEAVHQLAATWDDGRIAIYFDGRQVASGGDSGAGDLAFEMGDLRFGEDYPPTSLVNEPFLGVIDDLLVLRRVLSAEQIAALADSGPVPPCLAEDDAGILLTMEEPDAPLSDQLTHDGQQSVAGPIANQYGEVELLVNFATSAIGSIRCEIQDAEGSPIPGFTLADSDELYGDSLERAMSWNGNRELASLAGQAIRLRFVLKDSDLYSMRFGR